MLVHDPQVLLLDEPASGLDPRARIKIRELIKRLQALGKTIMVSSHILPELADICNKIGIIERGELIVNEKVSEVMQRIRQKSVLKIGLVGDLGAAVKLLASHPLVQQVEERNGLLAVSLVGDVADYTELPRVLIEAGFGLTLFQEEEMNLETAFMLLTEGISA